MKQLAWLHATPEGAKKTRAASLKDKETGDVSVQFPDLLGADYMVSMLHEAGLLMSNGMGVVPLTWQEIKAWLDVTELSISVWEKLMLREMSDTYVSELHRATGKHYPAPYVASIEVEQVDRSAVASRLLSVLRGFKRAPVLTEE